MNNKVALVTGGSRGIGLGIVQQLALQGFDIAINGVRKEAEVKDILESIKALGVEVIYISLDTDQAVFEQAVKSYPFFTYCDFMKWESPVVKDYYVFGTPTVYLLNNKREIILRPTSIDQVDAWVDWVLIQGNK